MRDGEGGALDSRGNCLCDQKTVTRLENRGASPPAMGSWRAQEAWGVGSEKIRGRREWAEKDGNVSIAVTGESQKWHYSVALPVNTSKNHSWPAQALSRAVGPRAPLCTILVDYKLSSRSINIC